MQMICHFSGLRKKEFQDDQERQKNQESHVKTASMERMHSCYSIHLGRKYPCNLCRYQAIQKDHIKTRQDNT